MGESINAAEIKKILEDNEERLRRYVSLLVKANELARLTGPSDEETLWRAHVADCASAVPLLPERGGWQILYGVDCMFKPIQLSSASLEPAVLAEDKKRCRRVGPCGLGEKALYLNSFYIDRRYYIPYSAITRVFKRVAMSKGGFTRRGVFASMAYLVVEYDGGKEKQCNFKYEEQVDQLLALLEQSHPEIKRVSAAAEQRLAQREKARRKEKKPEISPEAKAEIARLEEAAAFLEGRPELTLELSQAARRKRAYLCTNPSYRWVAMAITLTRFLSGWAL